MALIGWSYGGGDMSVYRYVGQSSAILPAGRGPGATACGGNEQTGRFFRIVALGVNGVVAQTEHLSHVIEEFGLWIVEAGISSLFAVVP
jgi:hypothetical protein